MYIQEFLDQVKSIRVGKSNVLHLMMWRPSPHQLHWTLPSPSSGTGWNRTCNYTSGHPCQYNTPFHCLSSALKTPISSSNVNIMNRYMGQPLDTPSAPLQPTCSSEKEFETRAINSATHQPRLCLRYVDYTFGIQKAEYSNHFLTT